MGFSQLIQVVDAKMMNDAQFLYQAVISGNVDLVQEKAGEGTTILPSGQRLFGIACGSGHLHLVEYFVDRDKTVLDICDRTGESGLYHAIMNKHNHIIKWLMDHNCLMDTMDLAAALDTENDEIIIVLLGHGVKVVRSVFPFIHTMKSLHLLFQGDKLEHWKGRAMNYFYKVRRYRFVYLLMEELANTDIYILLNENTDIISTERRELMSLVRKYHQLKENLEDGENIRIRKFVMYSDRLWRIHIC